MSGFSRALFNQVVKFITVHNAIDPRCLEYIATTCNDFATTLRQLCRLVVTQKASGIGHVNIGNHVDSVLQICHPQPCQFFSLLTGDFNFSAGDDRTFKIGRPEEDAVPATSCNSGTRQLQWEKHLKHWCEIWQPFPTHYNKIGNRCNRLDRAFSACPKSLLLKLNVSHSVIGTPAAVFARGESDHAPTALSFGKSVRSVASEPPIPAWITKHINFKFHVSSLGEYVDIFTLKPAEQLSTSNSCIQEVASVSETKHFTRIRMALRKRNWYCLRFLRLCGSTIWDLQEN